MFGVLHLQVIEISLRMTALHVQYSSTIISLARQATVNGWPINRPLWWIDPLDSEALAIDSGKYLNRVMQQLSDAMHKT